MGKIFSNILRNRLAHLPCAHFGRHVTNVFSRRTTFAKIQTIRLWISGNKTYVLKKLFERCITYKSYSELLQQYARKGKTSGEQKASFIEYTKLAAARQRRWEKTYRPEVNFIDAIYDCKVKGEQWLVFTETWCGDAAHALPFFNEWAIATKIPLRLVFRD